jgi:hypothetical protein
MADKKISALTAATTPLVGSEVLPIVQGASTVKVSVNNLTAGKTVPASALNITAPTYGNSGSISNPNDPNDQVLFTITNGANTNGGIARGGGTVLSLRDRTSNSGSGTVGYGLYVTAPYDGTNASGGTYALTKYGIFVDDIYNFYGLNATLGSTNYGLYVKGGGRNYLKADTQFDNNIVIGTAAKGIDFSANGGDVLSQYDEGTWVPTFTTWAVAPTVFSALYTRVGRQVTLNLLCQGGTCVAGSTIGGFPFTAGNSSSSVLAHNGTANSIAFTGIVYNLDNKVSGISAATLGAGYWGMSVTYFV